MHDLAFVLRHVKAGTKIKLYTDIYGAWLVEFRTGWLKRKIKVELEAHDVERLKDALRSRRHVQA